MNNVHTPQRLAGESFSDYKARRARSNAINKAACIVNGSQTSRDNQRDDMRKSGRMSLRHRFADTYLASLAFKRREAMRLAKEAA